MSDPRKTFRCMKCGFEINDMDRDTKCPRCIQIELDEKIRLEKMYNIESILLEDDFDRHLIQNTIYKIYQKEVLEAFKIPEEILNDKKVVK